MWNLVVTYAADHVAIFVIEDDDTTTQMALINTGSETPTPNELAMLGARLAKEFKWQGKAVTNGKPVAAKVIEKPAPAKVALPKAGKRKSHSGVPNPDDPPVWQRKAGIARVVKETPGLTRREIIERLGLKCTNERLTRWHHHFVELTRTNVIRCEGKQYYAVEEPAVIAVVENPDADPSPTTTASPIWPFRRDDNGRPI